MDNSENEIIPFYVSAVELLYVLGELDQVANIINLKIPYTFDLTSLVVSVKISAFSEISPALDNRFDFTKDVKFTVTAENSEERELGTPNRLTKEVRAVLKELVFVEISQVQSHFEKLDPMLHPYYLIPTPQSVI